MGDMASEGSTPNVIGRRQRLVVQRKDGKFLASGGDYPDRWVSDPLEATDRSNFTDLPTSLLWQKDCEVVEVEVTARLTGRCTADLFVDGKLVETDLRPSDEKESQPILTKELREHAEGVLRDYDRAYENQKDNGPSILIPIIANYGDLALRIVRSMLKADPSREGADGDAHARVK